LRPSSAKLFKDANNAYFSKQVIAVN